MSTIDRDAVRHAFAVLEETARWCDLTAATLRRRQVQVREDNAATPESYGGPVEDKYIDVCLPLDEAEHLAQCLSYSRDNIRGAANAIFGRTSDGGQP